MTILNTVGGAGLALLAGAIVTIAPDAAIAASAGAGQTAGVVGGAINHSGRLSVRRLDRFRGSPSILFEEAEQESVYGKSRRPRAATACDSGNRDCSESQGHRSN